MKRMTGLMGLIAVVIMAGCGYKSGTATGAREAFLYFTGDVEGVGVSVDDGQPFSVKPGRDNQYRVAPGRHTVKVYKGDAIIVEREIYVGDGIAKEIGVHQ